MEKRHAKEDGFLGFIKTKASFLINKKHNRELITIEKHLINKLNENNVILSKLDEIDLFQKNEINNRLLTIEWDVINNKHDIKYVIESIDQAKIESELSYLISNVKTQKFSLICDNALAIHSNDFKEPESTTEGMGDASWFIYEIERLIENKNISFLDIGCGSGALAFQFLKRDHFSVGLDGSDFCKKTRKGYWEYNDLLKTCDVTKKFHVEVDGKQRKFDLVTMWEVFEHIPEKFVASVLSNIHENLEAKGFFIGSISKLEYSNPKTGNVYHVTLKDYSWWRQKFEESGFIMIDLPIPVMSCCRGVGNRYQDPHSYSDNPNTGFQFCAIKNEI